MVIPALPAAPSGPTFSMRLVYKKGNTLQPDLMPACTRVFAPSCKARRQQAGEGGGIVFQESIERIVNDLRR